MKAVRNNEKDKTKERPRWCRLIIDTMNSFNLNIAELKPDVGRNNDSR